MYCKNCGKEIGDAKFCQYCGGSNDSEPKVTVNLIQKDFFATINDKVKQIGQEKLIKITAIISTIISIIVRIVNNKIKTVYDFLTQEDYLVVSESGRNYMIVLVALQIIILLFLFLSAKKQQTNISKKAIVLTVISLIIQVLAIVVRFPAPY